MDPKHELILLFTRFPKPGTSKTRLIPALGKKGAANLQKKMTAVVLEQIKLLRTKRYCDLKICYTGADRDCMEQWLGSTFSYEEQCSGDLGKRMHHSISNHLSSYRSVILVGSDCPSIDQGVFDDACNQLQNHDIVLGPSYDGGYYLIGVSAGIAPQDLAFLFTAMDWGQPDVLTQTINRADRLQISYKLLKKLHDIDTPADLIYFNYHTDT